MGEAWRRCLLAGLLLLLLAGLAFGYTAVVASTAGTVGRFDYSVLHASAGRADRGWDAYGPVLMMHADYGEPVLDVRHPNLNPPLFIAATIPLSRLDVERGYRVFMAITLALALASIPFLAASAPPGAPRIRLGVGLILLLGLSFPVFLSVRLGQVGHALLLPVAVAWWALRTGRERTLGVALGFGLALKVFFGLFLLVLMVGRRWRAATAMILTAVVASVLGSAPMGWRSYLDYAAQLRDVDWFSSAWNASALGWLTRIASAPAEVLTHPETAWVGAVCWGVAVTLVLLALLWAWRSAARHEAPSRWDAAFALTVAAMLVLSPLAWVYYLPLLVVPLLVASRDGSWPVQALAAGGWLLCSVPYDQGVPGELELRDLLLVQGGFPAYGLAALTVAAVLVARAGIPGGVSRRDRSLVS